MCNDMRRFEKMAEEKKRHEKEQKTDFIIKEPERITVTPESASVKYNPDEKKRETKG